MYPHPSDTPDELAVVRAAGLLDISEFRVFELAYRRWYGQEPADSQLERWFGDYMRHANVPFWVRYFTRDVLYRWHAGTLKPADFGIREEPLSPVTRRHGLLLSAVILALVILLLAVAIVTEAPPQALRHCYFPPCY
jgi:hypothetical protein